MKTFQYTIQDELGIHARPAGLLVKEAKKFQSVITLEGNGKKAEAGKLLAIMGMGLNREQRLPLLQRERMKTPPSLQWKSL